jgi:bifunctional DNA-binding transcriptional regulator/antitoxin component of YhaV-PrlF toxin-antitoxin module
MGQCTEIVKGRGVKYNISPYNKKEERESLDELKKILFEVTSEEIPDDEVMECLEILEMDYNIVIRYFGNMICDSQSNPSGLILSPSNKEANKFLEDVLKKINSKRKIEEYSEIKIS